MLFLYRKISRVGFLEKQFQRKENLMLYFWIAIVGLTAGIVVGAIISNTYNHKKTSIGALKVNTDDPDGPYLFLEIPNDKFDTITHKKQVILDVKIDSQK
jgi:hypothetical protein